MSVPNLPPGTKVFRYKLDFYYQQSLLYLVTLICYAGLRGTFDFEKLPTLDDDIAGAADRYRARSHRYRGQYGLERP